MAGAEPLDPPTLTLLSRPSNPVLPSPTLLQLTLTLGPPSCLVPSIPSLTRSSTPWGYKGGAQTEVHASGALSGITAVTVLQTSQKQFWKASTLKSDLGLPQEVLGPKTLGSDPKLTDQPFLRRRLRESKLKRTSGATKASKVTGTDAGEPDKNTNPGLPPNLNVLPSRRDTAYITCS